MFYLNIQVRNDELKIDFFRENSKEKFTMSRLEIGISNLLTVNSCTHFHGKGGKHI